MIFHLFRRREGFLLTTEAYLSPVQAALTRRTFEEWKEHAPDGLLVVPTSDFVAVDLPIELALPADAHRPTPLAAPDRPAGTRDADPGQPRRPVDSVRQREGRQPGGSAARR